MKGKEQDLQILEVLRSGEITMPLWGVSLDRNVAQRYGTRFLFLLEGPFRGIAAWRESGIKDSEQKGPRCDAGAFERGAKKP